MEVSCSLTADIFKELCLIFRVWRANRDETLASNWVVWPATTVSSDRIDPNLECFLAGLEKKRVVGSVEK